MKYATIVFGEEAGNNSATIQLSIGDTDAAPGVEVTFDPQSAAHQMAAYFTKHFEVLMATASELQKQGLLQQFTASVANGNMSPEVVASDSPAPVDGSAEH